MDEEFGGVQYIRDLVTSHLEEEDDEECFLFLNNINKIFFSINVTKEVPVIFRNEKIDIGTSDVLDLKSFQI